MVRSKSEVKVLWFMVLDASIFISNSKNQTCVEKKGNSTKWEVGSYLEPRPTSGYLALQV